MNEVIDGIVADAQFDMAHVPETKNIVDEGCRLIRWAVSEALKEKAVPHAYIWCKGCQAIQPAILDTLNGTAADIVCDACKLIIATFHREQRSTEPSAGEG